MLFIHFRFRIGSFKPSAYTVWFLLGHLVITFAAAKVLQINQLCKFFFKRKRNERFFSQCYKFRDHHRRSVGYLWAFGGFLQTRFYNNAAKIFGIIVILCRRFVNLAIKRCLKQAEVVDYKRLPLGLFFCYFFLRAEDCAESEVIKFVTNTAR